MNAAVVNFLIKYKQSKHEKTWDDLLLIWDAKSPTLTPQATHNQRPGLLVVLGCRTETSLCSRIALMSRVHISTAAPFSKRPNSQREHMQSHETCPRKTATPVTCGDCRWGPLNPQGRSHGPSMGWFNYTRKTLCVCMCVCVCIAMICFTYLAFCVDHDIREFFELQVISFFPCLF